MVIVTAVIFQGKLYRTIRAHGEHGKEAVPVKRSFVLISVGMRSFWHTGKFDIV